MGAKPVSLRIKSASVNGVIERGWEGKRESHQDERGRRERRVSVEYQSVHLIKLTIIV